MLNVKFESLVQDLQNEASHVLSASTSHCYSEILQLYEAVVSQIPSAPHPFPPTKFTVGAFLKYKKNLGASYSTLKNYIVALSHYCRTHNCEDVTKDPLIKDFMASANKSMLGSSFPYAVDAMKPEDLDKIAGKIDKKQIIHVRDIAMFTLQFECMLRVSELVKIQIDHITFSEDRYALFVPCTKTDQTGQGRNVIVYRSNLVHSSYTWVQEYLRMRTHQKSRTLFLTRGGKDISSHDVRDRLKYWVSIIGNDPARFSTHSLRKGGAQTAAFNGAFPSSIKHQG